jgi:hypothetical protein
MKKKPTIVINDKTRTAIKADGTRMPVLDATFTFLAEPNNDDIKNGIPGDHANCMYCLCFKRQYASELVWVTRRVAYVELKNAKGEPELRRFMLAEPARIAIGKFDAKKDVKPQAVVFEAPKGSDRLDVQRAKYRALVERKKSQSHNKAYVTGVKPPRKHSGAQQVNEFTALRSPATGMFQFHEKAESQK